MIDGRIMGKLFEKLVFVLFSSLVTVQAMADDSSYVGLSEALVASFECATLAAHARKNHEETRLVAYGIAKARVFVAAYRSGKISKEEMNQVDLVLPMVLRFWSFQKLDVPVDFTVGIIYEAIWTRITTEIGAQTGKMKESQQDYRIWATAGFKEKNCTLVGT